MFHQANNLYIGRLPNGDVRVLKLASNPRSYPEVDTRFPAHEVILDVTIPSGHWCSMVAAVTKSGESHYDTEAKKHQWYIALDLHNS